MKPVNLCLHCFKTGLVNNICTYCGKPNQKEADRNTNALPFAHFIFNRYYIGKVLGSGGFGITYLAWDSSKNRCVALKELYPYNDVYRHDNKLDLEIMKGQEEYFSHVQKRFLDEARNLASLRQFDEILKVYHLFPANGTAYYAMEYMEGMDLKSYIKHNNRMNWEQMLPILTSILCQLDILHSYNFIHRDISPDNIFLGSNGTTKLIDFGSARTYKDDNPKTAFLKHNFAPLEQYREDGEQGPWTDIYALSATIYYMLSGVLPKKAPDRVMNVPMEPINKLVPGLPKNVCKAITNGLAIEIKDRIKDAKSFAKALNLELPKPKPKSFTQKQLIIKVVSGFYIGNEWKLSVNEEITVGRSVQCTISYPPEIINVSRAQCTFIMDKNGLTYLKNNSVKFGTCLNSNLLLANDWHLIQNGDVVSFGNEKLVLAIA